jgi:hypothetical protein
MRIESSQVSYAAAHHASTSRVTVDVPLARKPESRPALDTVRLSAASASSPDAGGGTASNPTDFESLLALLVEWLSGRKFKSFRPGSASSSAAAFTSAAAPPAAAAAHRRLQLYSEAERTSFKAEGAVETADGRTIRFSATLDMQRKFSSTSMVTEAAQTTDPLVVNFGSGSARLTGGKIAFDLNSDGEKENISFVASGSGFLALDSNGDGAVNDGHELFGPRTGNGFDELAAYDADGNGWIDEADPVFSELRIWSQDGLSTLAEKGVGAIATSSVETPFALKDGVNRSQGDIRGTGVYLSESGVAGTVQQVDLAVG